MSEQAEHINQSSRLDRFLYYSKFALLIIVALLFLIAYSFFRRDLPASTAHYVFNYNSKDSTGCDEENFSNSKILVVMDYTDYNDDSYSNFYLLKNLLDSIPDSNYDLVLIDTISNGASILDNINNSLLLRIYHKKDYHHIISIGDNAVTASKEIKDLFFPSSQILLYGASSQVVHDTITPISSVSKTIANTIMVSKTISPLSKNLLFLCDDDDYSNVIINIVKENQEQMNIESFEILLSSEYSIEEAIDYINKQNKKSSLFYVSFLQSENGEILTHSDIINELEQSVDTPLYDLSPLTEGKDIRQSIRCLSLEPSTESLAYLGITPENKCIINYELIEFAARNIMSFDKDYSSLTHYRDNSAFIGWCMENVGFEQFPKTLEKQLSFCKTNSLLISKDNLQPGDLIFTSTKPYGSIDDIDGISIYVNAEIVVTFNKDGLITFTKPSANKYPITFAHPYSYLDNEEINSNQ